MSGGASYAKEYTLIDNWQRYLQNSPPLFCVCKTMTSIMSVDSVKCFALNYFPLCVVVAWLNETDKKWPEAEVSSVIFGSRFHIVVKNTGEHSHKWRLSTLCAETGLFDSISDVQNNKTSIQWPPNVKFISVTIKKKFGQK